MPTDGQAPLYMFISFTLCSKNEKQCQWNTFYSHISNTHTYTYKVYEFYLFSLVFFMLIVMILGRHDFSSIVYVRHNFYIVYYIWGRPKKNWMEGIKKVMNERNLNEGQWEDRKQWSLGIGQRRTMFWNQHMYIHTYIHTHTHIHTYIHTHTHIHTYT